MYKLRNIKGRKLKDGGVFTVINGISVHVDRLVLDNMRSNGNKIVSQLNDRMIIFCLSHN